MDFLNCLYCYFWCFFLTLDTLKIVLPSRRELDFYKIAFFEFDGKNIKKSSKNRWIFRSKFPKIRLKIALKTLAFWEDVFFWDFERIWDGFWEGLGGHGGSKIELFRAFIAISVKIRILRHLGVLWGWFWEGFGRVWGRF